MAYVPTDPHVQQAAYVARAGGAAMAVIVKIKRDGTLIVASYGEDRGKCDQARRISVKVWQAVTDHFKVSG